MRHGRPSRTQSGEGRRGAGEGQGQDTPQAQGPAKHGEAADTGGLPTCDPITGHRGTAYPEGRTHSHKGQYKRGTNTGPMGNTQDGAGRQKPEGQDHTVRNTKRVTVSKSRKTGDTRTLGPRTTRRAARDAETGSDKDSQPARKTLRETPLKPREKNLGTRAGGQTRATYGSRERPQNARTRAPKKHQGPGTLYIHCRNRGEAL